MRGVSLNAGPEAARGPEPSSMRGSDDSSSPSPPSGLWRAGQRRRTMTPMTSTQHDVTMTRWFPWAVVTTLTALAAIQVVFVRWAYLAFERGHACYGTRPCPLVDRYRPPIDVPAWSYFIVWFGVDLAVLLLGLWLMARRGAWSRGTLQRASTAAALALGVNMSLAYWWAMATMIGPNQSAPGECPLCFRYALQEQNTWTAINPGWIVLIWLGINALLWYIVRLATRRSANRPGPRLAVGEPGAASRA